MRGLGTW